MGKVAVMMSAAQVGAPMSEHFGKAEWILMSAGAADGPEFVANEAANGRGAAETIVEHDCTDAIFAGIGGGALGRLTAAGIHGWAAPKGISGARALELFAQKGLREVEVPVGHESGGCCCGSGGHAEQGGCCGR